MHFGGAVVKLLHEEYLIGEDLAAVDSSVIKAIQDIRSAVGRVVWPEGKRKFIIRPVLDGNGVMPIKRGFVSKLKNLGWVLEERIAIADGLAPGKIDAIYKTPEVQDGWIAAEWETGNISSSHRALSKLALGLLKGKLKAGILVLPDRTLYNYLTQRIGNYRELEPYFPLYKNMKISRGVLAVFSVTYDGISEKAPLIPKMFDGNAIRAAFKRYKAKGG